MSKQVFKPLKDFGKSLLNIIPNMGKMVLGTAGTVLTAGQVEGPKKWMTEGGVDYFKDIGEALTLGTAPIYKDGGGGGSAGAELGVPSLGSGVTDATQAAADQIRARTKTLLTGGAGVLGNAPTYAPSLGGASSLLGGVRSVLGRLGPIRF